MELTLLKDAGKDKQGNPIKRVMFSKVDDSDIIWRNFSGKDYKTGRPGSAESTFDLRLTEDLFGTLVEEGWDAREYRKKDAAPDDPPTFVQDVAVSKRGYNDAGDGKSIIFQVSDANGSGRRTKNLISVNDIDILGSLDATTFDTVTFIGKAWWHKDGKNAGKMKMYIESMIYTIAKPDFAAFGSEWADVFDSAPNDTDGEEIPF